MSKNRIKPIPPSLGNSKITMGPRAMQGSTMTFEVDLPLLGIVKETNNYPVTPLDFAILTTNGEYIDVGDNFYLEYL